MDDLKQYLIDGYLPSIGIECHVQLKTNTKLFTAINNEVKVDDSANNALGPLCLGLPGTLPVINKEAINLAIKAGLVLEAKINLLTSFDRKHYFYPDLPLGYQISQHYRPIVGEGVLEIPSSDDQSFKVRIERAHLEADAGKLSHQTDFSLVDLNRVGSPLLEIVSYPDMHSSLQAKQYAKELYLRMTYAQVCEGDLSAGHLRFDVNVSVSKDFKKLGTRTELKNINSFRFVEQAVDYEIKRQIKALESDQAVIQQTRGWDENKKITVAQRSKEDAQDYRYMPDPDIPPITIDEQQINNLSQDIKFQTTQIRDQLKVWQIAFKSREALLDWQPLAEMLMLSAAELITEQAQLIVNWLLGDIASALNKSEMSFEDVSSAFNQFKDLAQLVLDQTINTKVARDWLKQLIIEKADLKTLVKDSDQLQISDKGSLQVLIKEVFKENPSVVEQAKINPKVSGFLIGQVMKKQAGANPQIVAQLIQAMLKDPSN